MQNGYSCQRVKNHTVTTNQWSKCPLIKKCTNCTVGWVIIYKQIVQQAGSLFINKFIFINLHYQANLFSYLTSQTNNVFSSLQNLLSKMELFANFCYCLLQKQLPIKGQFFGAKFMGSSIFHNDIHNFNVFFLLILGPEDLLFYLCCKCAKNNRAHKK